LTIKVRLLALGAEIKDNKAWYTQFTGKKLYNEAGEYKSVAVVKGGVKNKNHEVDAISGATITGNGVDDMLDRGLAYYEPYHKERIKKQNHKNNKKMAEVLTKKEAGAFSFGKEEKKLLTDPLNDNNPITVQVLGVCSALAVTTLLSKAIVMGIAVTLCDCTYPICLRRMLRNYIPKSIRMIVQLVIIAFLVTVVEVGI
jgi:hypothetical protein